MKNVIKLSAVLLLSMYSVGVMSSDNKVTGAALFVGSTAVAIVVPKWTARLGALAESKKIAFTPKQLEMAIEAQERALQRISLKSGWNQFQQGCARAAQEEYNKVFWSDIKLIESYSGSLFRFQNKQNQLVPFSQLTEEDCADGMPGFIVKDGRERDNYKCRIWYNVKIAEKKYWETYWEKRSNLPNGATPTSLTQANQLRK